MAEYVFLIFLALIAGASLGINRAILGLIGKRLGSIEASVINHISGALFLVILMLALWLPLEFEGLLLAPYFSYLGGIVGAIFVIITSFVIPKIGVLKTSVLLISGQVICGTLIDFFEGTIKSIPTALLGVTLIIFGVLIGFYNQQSRSHK